MKYYTINLDANNSTAFIEEIQSNMSKVGKEFSKGEKIKFKEPFFEAIYTTESEGFADVLSVSPLIVNEKTKNIIEATGVSMEFFDILLKGKKSKVKKTGYFIINILNNINAIDYEKSKIEFYPETDIINSMSKLILNNTVSSNEIFSVEKIKRETFISSNIKELLKGTTGLTFKDSTEFSKI
ncbi:MAG: hypothetical protein HRT69_14605 [Flavobacteriaceae bacterium]|nr:hypothetical protein [Flavobacteriaceae bacterium]